MSINKEESLYARINNVNDLAPIPLNPTDMKLGVKIPWRHEGPCTYSVSNTLLVS